MGINQYPFLKDTPTSKAKHLVSAANNAEAIAYILIQQIYSSGTCKLRLLPA
ncbi:MAG: hypothetical protein RM368_31250 [Nostoc sp. DedSLP03]|nr:hypothetical protein [Nostoc sp. DedSLP03]